MLQKTIYTTYTTLILILAFLFFLPFAPSPSALAQVESEKERMYETTTLEVTGKGEIAVSPNKASLTFVVESSAKTAKAAAEDNAKWTKSVLDNLKSLIGKEDKVKTTAYQLSPVYEYNEKTRRSELVGYRASNQVLVETGSLEKLGTLIDSGVEAGADRVEGLSFTNSKSNEYVKEALVKAIAQARETAEVVAKSLGMKIGRIIKISPSQEIPIPVYQRTALRAEAAAPTPIEPGDITVRASVYMVFELQ